MIARIRFLVTGQEPGLLMSNPRTSMAPKSGGRSATKNIPLPAEEAASRVYQKPDGGFWFPAEAFRSAIIDAASGFKYGKFFAPTQFKKGLMLTSETVDLIDPESGAPITTYEIDVRRAVVQGNGVMRARPLIPHWAAVVEFEFETDFVQAPWVEETLERAGKAVGIGDYRPMPPKFSKTGRGGRFGRFTVQRLGD